MFQLPTESSGNYWSFYEIWAYLCGDLDAVKQINQPFEGDRDARLKKVIDLLEGWDPDRSSLQKLTELLYDGEIQCSAKGLDGNAGERIELEPDDWYAREFRYPPPEALVPNSPTYPRWLRLRFFFNDSYAEISKAPPNKTKKNRSGPKVKYTDELCAELHSLITIDNMPMKDALKEMQRRHFDTGAIKSNQAASFKKGLRRRYKKYYLPRLKAGGKRIAV